MTDHLRFILKLLSSYLKVFQNKTTLKNSNFYITLSSKGVLSVFYTTEKNISST